MEIDHLAFRPDTLFSGYVGLREKFSSNFSKEKSTNDKEKIKCGLNKHKLKIYKN